MQPVLRKLSRFSLCLGFTLLFVVLSNNVVNAETYGVIIGNNVNVRSCAQISDKNRLFQVNRGTQVLILDADGDFFRAHVNGNEYVYVSRQWVQITETRGIVCNFSDTVYTYNKPREKGGQLVAHLLGGSYVTVTSSFDNWFGVYHFGELVFVEMSKIKIPNFVELPRARIPGLVTVACEIVELAMQYLGSPYRWGGTTPAGFDCSGFMVYLFRHFDISLNRVSRDMAHNGVHVLRSELMPGDLVFFAATPGGTRITHVGMYIGNGYLIHSSTYTTGVIISSMSSSWNNPRFVTARRVIL